MSCKVLCSLFSLALIVPVLTIVQPLGHADPKQSHDVIGLAGFQFARYPMDYRTRAHHSNIDGYDRIQAADTERSKDLPAPSAGCTASGGSRAVLQIQI